MGKSRQKEVDFVVCRQSKALELIQVSYSTSNEKTFAREMSALTQAAEKLGCNKLTLITMDETNEIVHNGHPIRVCTATEWFAER